MFSINLKDLELLVGDQKGPKLRAELQHIVDEFKAMLIKLVIHWPPHRMFTLRSIKRDSRKALLESKRTIDSMSKSNREELLKSSAVTEKIDEKSPLVLALSNKVAANLCSSADALMQANNDVTEALRRTIGIMQGELERSVLSNQMLGMVNVVVMSTSSPCF